MLQSRENELQLNFYYDETNNIRKYYLKDKEDSFTNSDKDIFILGGIAIPDNLLGNNEFNNSIHELFKNLGMQKTQKELKFKHIAKGNFSKILTSNRLKYLFKFIKKNRIFIHFMMVDIIHWSLIDIMESQSVFKCCNKNIELFEKVKSSITEVAKYFRADFFEELYKIGYPNISNNIHKFIFILKKYLRRYINTASNIQICRIIEDTLIPLLEDICISLIFYNNKYIDLFYFLKDEPKHTLINSFDIFYQYNITHFPKSLHFFDEEIKIMDRINECNIFPSDYKNYKFIKSDNEKLIQLSDIFIGFLRNLFTYLSNNNINKINSDYEGFSEEQKKCLKYFFSIYEKSVEKEKEMLIFINSFFDREKFYFLKSLSDNF